MHLPASLLARVPVTLALAATLLLGASGTHAVYQPLVGKKLLIKNPASGTASNKVVHLSKDPAITLGAAGGDGDPQCTGAGGGGGYLYVGASGGAGTASILLPCAGWTTNSDNSLYKYKDPTGASCKLVLVKNGVLAKAVCKGPQVAIDLNASTAPVDVVTVLNTQRYCTQFGGTLVDDGAEGVKFLAKDAAATDSCADTTTPTTTSTSSTSTSSTPVPTTTSTTNPSIACCQGNLLGANWCNEGQPSPSYEEGCTAAPVLGTYYPGLRCDAAYETCGAVRRTGDCCEVESTVAVCAEVSELSNDGYPACVEANGDFFVDSECNVATGACSFIERASCSGSSACGSCGSTCSGAGLCARAEFGASCEHLDPGTPTDVCFNAFDCVTSACTTDSDCNFPLDHARKACVKSGVSTACCSRCP